MIRGLVVLLLLVPTLAQAQFSLGVRRGVALNLSSDPAGVALADFDRDGNLDIAVTERGLDLVSLFFGDGTGKMGPRVTYPTGDSPNGLVAGDLNGDGRVDLAIANGASNSVTLYLGGPLGLLVNRKDFPVGSTPFGIALGDANSDGRLDVVTANSGSSSITILPGKGTDDGLAADSITVPTGTGPRAVLVADLNRDGVYDLVTANTAADSISVLEGLPAGGFKPRMDTATNDQPTALALGDLDVDGYSDLAIATAGTSAVGIAINSTGFFPFPTVTTYQADNNPDAVEIADFDGNAIPDLVVGHAASNLVTFVSGNGNGTFGFKTSFTSSGAGARAIGVGDLDGDGRKDVVVPIVSTPKLNWYLNNGLGPFGPALALPAGTMPQGLVVADFNADARPDIAVANAGSANLSRFMNQGDGVFGSKVDIPAPPGPTYLVAADLNGDFNPDLVTSTYRSFQEDTNRVSVYLNPGNGAFAARTDYDAGTAQSRTGLAVGDVTHDGKIDIVVGHSTSTVAQILAGNGLGAFTVGPTLTVFNEPTWIDLADLDANGSLDAVVGGAANFSSGLFSVFKADGAGGFAPRVDYSLPGRPAAITHGDIDKDGNLDVAALDLGNGTVSIFFGNGTGTLVPGGTLLSPGSSAYSVTLGDVNQDGDLDVMSGRADTDAALFYGSTGGVMSTLCRVSQAGNGMAGIALATLDGNSTLDLVLSNQESGTISILRGRAKTRTKLVVDPNPSSLGQSLTFQATVTKAFPDSANPTGTVRFFDGVRLLGTAPLVGGVATLVQSGNVPWDRELSAAYLGDGRFFGSFSAPVPHTTYVPTVGVPPSGLVSTLALAPLSNPMGRTVRLRVELAGPAPARLTMVDVRGRVLEARAVDASGVVELAPSRTLSPGVYLVRIEQAGKVATARAVVL